MTKSGVDLYQEMRPIAEERERIMLERLSTDEQAQLRTFLAKMLEQRPALYEYDTDQLGGLVDAHDLSDVDG